MAGVVAFGSLAFLLFATVRAVRATAAARAGLAGRPEALGRRRTVGEAEDHHLRRVGDEAALGVPQRHLDRGVAVAGGPRAIVREEPARTRVGEEMDGQVGARAASRRARPDPSARLIAPGHRVGRA